MDDSFASYLLAKQSVDDRALNRPVYENLVKNLRLENLRIIEVGAGIGTMLVRMLRWGLIQRAEYVLVDELGENINFARKWLPSWASKNGLQVEKLAEDRIRFFDRTRQVVIELVQAEVNDFIHSKPEPANLMIAHAFLDLLPLPESLPGLFSLLRLEGLAWLTINFDGVSIMEPALDPGLDQQIEQLYHRTMDTRPTGGDSQSGRHLFGHLTGMGASILAAGASDWVVHALQGSYPADEAAFLSFILQFYESSLQGMTGLDQTLFANWLAERRAQLERGELVYIAHQMDFLVKPQGV